MTRIVLRPAFAYQQHLPGCIADIVLAFFERLRGWLLGTTRTERSRQKGGEDRVHDR